MTRKEEEVKPVKEQSRRQLLAIVAGALGALGVGAIAKPSPAAVADGDPVFLGQSNTPSRK